MKLSEFATKASDYILHFIKNEKYKSLVRSRTQTIIKWLAMIIFIITAVGYLINGSELITIQFPKLQSYISKQVLLGKSFREHLAERTLKKQFGYPITCIASVELLDLDNDGQKTDMVINLYSPVHNNLPVSCPEYTDLYPSYHIVIKETKWDSFWPEYALLKVFSREVTGDIVNGSGLPLTFENIGPFIIASPYGTDFVQYNLLGYSNGVLTDLGLHWGLGGSEELDLTVPRMLIGNKLIMQLSEGLFSFEIGYDGIPKKLKLSTKDIIDINQSTIILEDTDYMDDDPTNSPDKFNIAITEEYNEPYLYSSENEECPFVVYANGTQIEFEHKAESKYGNQCIGRLEVFTHSNIVPMMPCFPTGLTKTNQFPWGYMLDLAVKESYLSCRPRGEDGDDRYVIEVAFYQSDI